MDKHKLHSNNLPKERDAYIKWTVHTTLFMYSSPWMEFGFVDVMGTPFIMINT